MADESESSCLERERFLSQYNFTADQLKAAGLEWSVLQRIYEKHLGMMGELQTTATYISQRLQTVPAIHSLNVRIKNPEHLIEKIVRKKIAGPDRIFDEASYENQITDLIGIRALHLFKDDWCDP
jgi:putative GTP pyrophosphokinase